MYQRNLNNLRPASISSLRRSAYRFSLWKDVVTKSTQLLQYRVWFLPLRSPIYRGRYIWSETSSHIYKFRRPTWWKKENSLRWIAMKRNRSENITEKDSVQKWSSSSIECTNVLHFLDFPKNARSVSYQALRWFIFRVSVNLSARTPSGFIVVSFPQQTFLHGLLRDIYFLKWCLTSLSQCCHILKFCWSSERKVWQCLVMFWKSAARRNNRLSRNPASSKIQALNISRELIILRF